MTQRPQTLEAISKMPRSTVNEGSTNCLDGFLIVCPMCESEAELSKVHLNKEISCAVCTYIFTAEEKVLVGKEVSSQVQSKVSASEDIVDTRWDIKTRNSSQAETEDKSSNARKDALRELHSKRNAKLEKKGVSIIACVGTPGSCESRPVGKEMEKISLGNGIETEMMIDADTHVLGNKKNERQAVMEITDTGTNAFEGVGCGMSPREHEVETISDEEIRFKRNRKPVVMEKTVVDTNKGIESSLSPRKQDRVTLSDEEIQFKRTRKTLRTRRKNVNKDLYDYGVALRKAPRQRKRINRFSPGDENPSRKKAQKVKGDQGSGLKIAGSFVDLSDGLLKSMITEEIQKQVLDDLLARGMNAVPGIEVVALENIYPSNEAIPDKGYTNNNAQQERFIAKVKIMATLEFPINMQQSEPSECYEQKERMYDDIMHEIKHTDAQAPIVMEQHDTKEQQEVKLTNEAVVTPTMVESLNTQKDDEGKGTAQNPEVVCAGSEDSPNTLCNNFKYNNCEEMVVKEKPEIKAVVSETVDYAELEDVPQTLYYNFDCARSVERFADGQVWACYSDDGMPRGFILIKKVISVNPFKVHAALLEPASSSSTDLPTCGQYKISSTILIIDDVGIFSHMVVYGKGVRGTIEIYPNVRQVWALYKNWARTGLVERQKSAYDIVLVTDVWNDRTVIIKPLMRIGQYKTVYAKQLDVAPTQIRKEDLVRFSHQIPEFKLLGSKGWFELDPAAIPFGS